MYQIDKRHLHHCGFLVAATGLLGILLTGVDLARGENPLQFEARAIETEAVLVWARALGDVDGNGRTEILLQDNNGHGGTLRWYETSDDAVTWKTHLIAEQSGFARSMDESPGLCH